MSQLIYIDTNIWLDYFMNRNKGMLDLAEVAVTLFRRTVLCEFKILISSALIYELEKYVPKEKLLSHFEWINPKIVIVEISKQEESDSKKLGVHYPDCIHLYISRKYTAKLISNDIELQMLGAIPSHTL